MENVRVIQAAVNPTIEDVCAWLESKGERGELPENSARLRVTALRQVVSVMADDEAKDARAVLNQLEALVRRWATKNAGLRGETAKTYESRARSALEDYFKWVEDPTGFQFRRRDPISSERTEERKKPPRAATSAGEPPPPPSTGMRTFPLGQGREFTFRAPDDLVLNDVKKIAYHLMTLASDFDPSAPFSMLPSRDQ